VADPPGAESRSRGEIVVLAGTNGAGKSSVAGAALRSRGTDFYNPDEATQRYVAAGLSLAEANSRAWHQGRRLLERAIEERLDFAFETTLGGHTITALLLEAARQGLRVRIFYVGLASPELHIERVRARVERGGHHIPEHKVRERWTASRENLIRLLPHVTELALWDNSAEADPGTGRAPEPVRILWMKASPVEDLCPLNRVPNWAKAIVAAAIECDPSGAGS